MRPSDYTKLEQDKNFKRYYLGKTLWWKNFLFIAPAALLFIGLAGTLHMTYNDKLITLYALPYVIVFALGTIWLKALKKHVQGRIFAKEGYFLTCAAKPIGTKDGRFYFLFSKDSKRHNEPLIYKLADKLSLDSFSADQLKMAKKKITPIEVEGDDNQFYIRAIQIATVRTANKDSNEANITPLVHLSTDDTFVIRKKDLL